MPVRDPLLGFSTDSLRFDELLGRGGMGAVYRGLQIRLDRPVAIKVIKPDLAADPGYRERFVREAQTMGRLIHPHVIACHDFGPIVGPDGGELLVMVMEYVAGASLGKLAGEERLPVRQVLEWYRQAAEALAAAHRLGVIHRDFKPDNIMVTREGVAKLADFGLARASDSIQVTATGALIGSPAYMSPEASLGHEPVPLSDVYSLACSMFQTLAGRPPYHATSTLQVLHQHVSAPPPSFAAARSDLVLLEPLLTRCLSKQAKDRPAPEVVARELAAIAASIPAHARCATPGQARLLPAARPPPTATAIVATVPAPNLPHQRLLVLGAVVVGLLGMLVTIGVLKKLPRGEPPAAALVESDASAPPAEPVPVAPAVVTTSRITPLLAGSGMLGAELAPGHPLAPVGAPAPAGQAPRLLMSQQGRLRLRPPPGSGHLALVLHPGSGSEEREMRLDGRSLRLRPGVWQVVEQPCSGKQELVLEAVGSAPFYCAAAVASPFGLSWQDLGVNASALLAPGVAPLRLLLTHHHLTADYSRTVFVAKPLAMRLFGDAARQHIAAAFVQGQAPESLLIETQEVSDAVRQAIQGGTRWCFMLLDAGDVPTGTLRADNWCVVVEDALRQGTLIIPVLGGLPTARNQNLWATWFEQVGKRLPGLPVLDLSAVHEFHSANDLPPADARAMAEGLAVALRDLRARLTTALRPLP